MKAGIGPAFDYVPYGDFSSVRIKEKEMIGLWNIVGPSVALNLERDLPLWKVITMAYVEGLNHGAGLQQEINSRTRRGSLYENM